MKLKIGDLVYLKDVGFPYDGKGNCKATWEGASCTILDIDAGALGNMIRVKPIIPIGGMEDCLFFAHNVKYENRPWLRDNLQKILHHRERLIGVCKGVINVLEDK